jgi:hypothetical protein
MQSVGRVRFVDDVFEWSYLYSLEMDLTKRKVLSVGPQDPDGPVTIHAKLPPDWAELSQPLGPYEQPGPAKLPQLSTILRDTALRGCLDHRLTAAHLNYDVMGNPHPAPTRPGSLVVMLFMSSMWPQELGSEVFFYADETRRDIIAASSPLFNRAIVFDGAVPYAVRPPTRAAVYPRLSATFVLERGANSDALLGGS